jgi:hypothetical protein
MSRLEESERAMRAALKRLREIVAELRKAHSPYRKQDLCNEASELLDDLDAPSLDDDAGEVDHE